MPDYCWYAVYSNVVDLAEWLIDEHGYNEKQILWYLQRPERYQREWEEFNAAQRASNASRFSRSLGD